MAADREERQRIHDEVAAIKVDALKALRELAAQYLEAHRSPVSEISRRSGRRSELIRFMPQRHANGDETHDALIGATHI
ncbi:MAG TPA: hypothetical protein VJ998_07345 [Pseudomonadales bacterium]|nr:hypothetical protein [Pseudomonadales bacterium]